MFPHGLIAQVARARLNATGQTTMEAILVFPCTPCSPCLCGVADSQPQRQLQWRGSPAVRHRTGSSPKSPPAPPWRNPAPPPPPH
jgi:hypothetical protein